VTRAYLLGSDLETEEASMSKRTSKKKSRKKRGANHGKRPNSN
jgi:hypothetical protein